MEKYHNSIKEKLYKELSNSALGYLATGMRLFHAERKRPTCIQPIIGNLGIAIELMLKVWIIKNNPALLFKDLPLELKVLFITPKSIPSDFNWRRYDIDLRSFNFKSIELDECISLFNIFFPKFKQQMHPYFRLLSKTRNISVHAAIPQYHIFDLDRTGYLALRLFGILNEEKAFPKYTHYYITKEDNDFLSSFEEDRAERVRKKIEAAKEKSKTISTGKVSISIDEWELYVTSCTICGSDGIMEGYCDMVGDQDDEGTQYASLFFFSDTFKCDECGLHLEDSDEMALAGMETNYDRSYNIDKWFASTEGY